MILLIILLFIMIVIRCFFQKNFNKCISKKELSIGAASFIGDMEVQADSYTVLEGKDSILAALADGFGKGCLGKVASQKAIEICHLLYKQYKTVDNPYYFFKRAFNLANFEVLKILEDRPGGTSLLVSYINHGELFYALAGDIKISVFRGDELIPLSEGHTLNKLAYQAYQKGELTKQKALWTLKEDRLWNYIGEDGFKEIEFYDTPVRLKQGDTIVLMTKGIYQNIEACKLESILSEEDETSEQKALAILEEVKAQIDKHRENASLIIIKINET